MIKKIFFLIGLLLIVINIYGLFIPLRNDEIYSEKKISNNNSIILTEKQLWHKINSDTSDIRAYIKLLNTAVHNGIAHYWSDEGIDKYNLRIPIYENYFLYFASWLYPPVFKKYEFSHYKKAIERGVGLCSQYAIVIVQILKEKGINSKIIGLDGHVVAIAQVDSIKDQWWVLDPDYGVVVPNNMFEIENNPSLISSYYKQKGYTMKQINLLIDIFGSNGNKIVNGVTEYDSRIKSYSLRYYIESLVYPLKWLLPLLLMIPYSLIISKVGKDKDW